MERTIFETLNLGHRFSQISTGIWFFVAFNILVIRVHPCSSVFIRVPKMEIPIFLNYVLTFL